MLGIWSIAKHTFAQCMRMKLAAAFAVLLTAALLALPAQMTGDGTLAGQIRAFLSYGTGISLGLLSIMSCWLWRAWRSTQPRRTCEPKTPPAWELSRFSTGES